MARDRKKHVREDGSADCTLAKAASDPHPRELFLHLIRSLAREAARRDHAADAD